MSKTNPILAQYAAGLRRTFDQELGRHLEIDRIALLLMINDTLSVGPGRAGQALNDFLAAKTEVAEAIIQDSQGDGAFTFTRHQLAVRLQQILGPEASKRYRDAFPLLREYWEE